MWYFTTLPILYEHISINSVRCDAPHLLPTIKIGPANKEPHYTLDEASLYALYRAILEKPELGDLVKSLELVRTSIFTSVPKQILTLTPNLTTLHYDYLMPLAEKNRWGRNKIDCHDLQLVLDQVKGTLKQLKITYMDLTEDVYTFSSSDGHCSLKALSELEVVEIPIFILVGNKHPYVIQFADTLSHSLVHLTFGKDQWSDDVAGSDEYVWNLLVNFVKGRAWERTAPGLKTINVLTPLYDVCCQEMEFKRLCTENGLLCERFAVF
jgi:hypothetical protein